MNGFSIRLATQNDITQLVKLVSEYREFYGIFSQDLSEIYEFISNRIANFESKIFIAVNESNNDMAGFIQLYPSFSTVSLKPQWILNDFYVRNPMRNQGIGTALMNAVIDYFKGEAKGFILVTEKTNVSAKKFYKKIGWQTDVYDFYFYTYAYEQQNPDK